MLAARPTQKDILEFILITVGVFAFLEFLPPLGACGWFSLDLSLADVKRQIAGAIDDRSAIFLCFLMAYSILSCWRGLSREQRRIVLAIQVIAAGVLLVMLFGACFFASIVGWRPAMTIAFIAALVGLIICAAFSSAAKRWIRE